MIWISFLPSVLFTVCADEIRVLTVFGTGRAAQTDSIGLHGEINHPSGVVFNSDESYLYMTDQSRGGSIRKLAVAEDAVYSGDSYFYSLFGSKTVFNGIRIYVCISDIIFL